MDRNRGFITIDRNITRWGWFKDHNTLIVFLYLILTANIKDNMFMGVNIERGQLATSHASLAKSTSLTVSKVRTALEHLQSTGEIAIKRYSKFIVITITGYEKYQTPTIKSQADNNHLAIKSQSNRNNQTMETMETMETKRKGRSAPHPPSGAADTPYALKMKPISEGTVDDIPEEYRADYKTYEEYWRFRNR